MKKVLIAVVTVSALLISCKGEKKEKVETNKEVEVAAVVSTNTVDVASSVMTWKGTKPTGSHNGIISLKEGSFAIKEGKLVGGTILIDMNSIDTKDLQPGKGKEKLDGHLKAPDFFDVAKFPTSKFEIASVEELDGNVSITGNLTIKDVTKSITIPASMSSADGVFTLKSDVFTIDRADFNVKYGSKKWFENLKDKFIDDLVELSFEVKTEAAAI